jgi:hypothetical protein
MERYVAPWLRLQWKQKTYLEVNMKGKEEKLKGKERKPVEFVCQF